MPGLLNLNKERVSLLGDTPAVLVPDGIETSLGKGIEVTIIQELGGDFTVHGSDGRMYRIEGEYAPNLGKEPPKETAQIKLDEAGGKLTEEIVWEQLRTCYDPEIPCNIVELGLIYDLKITHHESGKCKIDITMTLTAPGCGMGQVIADDVKRKVKKLSAVGQTNVELVFDPPWSPSMMSEAAKLVTGMM